MKFFCETEQDNHIEGSSNNLPSYVCPIYLDIFPPSLLYPDETSPPVHHYSHQDFQEIGPSDYLNSVPLYSYWHPSKEGL